MIHSRRMKYILLMFAPFALAVTLAMGTAYALAQQTLRQSANDPQIQMAEDLAAGYANGQPIRTAEVEPVDMAKSLAPFYMVFDGAGKTLATTGYLDGSPPPAPPHGVFDYASAHGSDRITWQPAPNVRLAAVVVPFQGTGKGFVLAGRSLREVENRESDLLHLTMLAWLVTMVATFVVMSVCGNLARRDSD